MSSQADIFDIAGAQDAPRGVFSLGPRDFPVYPFEQWKVTWQRLENFRATGRRMVVLLGDPGTGKSTMLESLARALIEEGKSVTRLQGAQVDGCDFLQLAAITLGLNPEIHEPQALEAQLREYFRTESAHRELHLLVDDADVFHPSALEALLGLANLQPLNLPNTPQSSADDSGIDSRVDARESPTGRSGEPSSVAAAPARQGSQEHAPPVGPLIVLTGCPRLLRSLGECLVDPENDSQLGLATLGTLTKAEIHGYLMHCLARSKETEGAKISVEAADAIHYYSQGIPRVANRIAARLLFLTLQQGSESINGDDVARAVDDLQTEGLLDVVPPTPGADVAWEASIGNPDLARDLELPPAIDKPMSELIASQLDVERFDDCSAVPRQSDDGVGRSSRPPQLTTASQNRPVSNPERRRKRSLVAAFALVMVLFTLAVGLKFWNEDDPLSEFASYFAPRSDERVSGASEEPKPQLGESAEPAGKAPTLLAPKPPEILPPPPQEIPIADPPVAVVPQIEREPMVIKEPPASDVEDSVASLVKHRSSASTEPSEAAGKEDTQEATHGTANEPGPLSSSVTAAASEQLIRGVDLDRAGPVETPGKLATVVDKPDPATITPPPSVAGDEVFPSGVAGAAAPNSGSQHAASERPVDQGPSSRSQIALLGNGITTMGPPSPPERGVEDPRIQRLLRAAELDLQNNRLTIPEGENAFQRYQAVLKIEPENSTALEGLEAIARSYVTLIERARADGEMERALAYLDRVDTVLPEFPDTQRLRLQIREDRAGGTRFAGTEGLSQEPPETKPPILEQFVMLPARTGAGCAWPFDRQMTDTIRSLIHRAARDRVVLSTPASKSAAGGLQESPFWRDASPNEVPNEQQVYRYGERVGARWVLLLRIDCPSSALVYEPWKDFQLHLFDVERGIAHQEAGTLGEIASITERFLLATITVDGG